MSSPQTVHVVDDDDIFRDVVAVTLQEAGYGVAHYDSGPALLAALDTATPGCILLDMHMSPLNGLQVQEALNARDVGWPVIVTTARGDIRLAVEAMKNGAVEFIEKPFETEHLLGSVRIGFERQALASEKAATDAAAKALVETLTRRELQVTRGLLGGLSSKQIARALGLSNRTVEIYRASLMPKLHASNLSGVVRVALAAGLAPLVAGEAA